ncbi:MAG TPA: sigma-70 family RNA polymerase sigma factor [Tepidisphaeraceae bacterium]|nr:sigma-70 family RNA polymerase sigma factor [Tepidisphaeraceae bacterium]
MAAASSHLDDDFALMQAIAAGDRAALERLYDRHSPLVLAVSRRVLKDAAEAEDVLTTVFFEVWSRADRFDASRGSPLSYLTTLARSRAIDRRRSRAARPVALSSENSAAENAAAMASTAPTPLQSSDINEQRQRIRAALAELEPAQREAIECSFYEGLSHSEIAEKLQKPLGTVKTYIRQGLIRLRDRIRT